MMPYTPKPADCRLVTIGQLIEGHLLCFPSQPLVVVIRSRSSDVSEQDGRLRITAPSAMLAEFHSYGILLQPQILRSYKGCIWVDGLTIERTTENVQLQISLKPASGASYPEIGCCLRVSLLVC